MGEALQTVALCLIAAILGVICDTLRHIRDELRRRNDGVKGCTFVGGGTVESATSYAGDTRNPGVAEVGHQTFPRQTPMGGSKAK